MIQHIINLLINYSKNKAKFIFINLALMLCVFSVDAIPMSANSYKTKPIQGHAPYMHSIAARLDIDKNPAFTENGEAILTIGSIVYIPSEICNIPTITLESGVIPIDQLFFYYFHDQDRDDCIGLDHEIEWYMLQSNEKPWEEVNSWSELSATLISNQDYPEAIIEPSLIYPGLRTPGLKVPQEAVGSRIGFIYKAYSKHGVPFVGPTIKVWDLNYFFSQNATSKNQSNQSLNEGSRTNLILDNSKAGGVVQPTPLPPSIESLKITGEFALGKQLKAEYIFISNGSADAEDRSLFWWGLEGTTAYLAAQAPTSGSSNAQSGILTESDLGQVLEVTVLPSKLEQRQLVRGSTVTVTTRENNNEIQYAPSLLELTIESRFPEADGLVVNDMIYGQYRMQFGTNEQDASRYEWRRGLTNEIIQQGSTLPAIINAGSQGLTAPLILIPDLIGDFITLTVFPIDRNNLEGKSLTVSTGDISPLPFIDNLTLIYEQTGTSEPPEFGLEVNHMIYGTYEFTSFTQSVDRSIYNWEIDGSNELIQSGTANNGIVPSIRIQPEYLGQTIRLIVTAVDSVNRIGNLRNVVSGIVNQIQPEVTSVSIIYLDDQYMLSVDHSIKGQYKFIPAVEGTSDNSSYIWQIKSNGAILEQGKTLIENGLGVTPEFKIPFSTVGEIITLTILPFDNAGREGQPQTVDSLIVDYSYPVITDIGLIYPRDMPPESVSVGQRLGAFYSINEGEQPLDNSEYEWRLLGLGVVLDQGQTIKPPSDLQGYIPPVVIPGYAIGDVVQLTVQPVDIMGIRGVKRTVQTGELQDLFPYIEQLAFLNRADQQLDFRVGQPLSASYQFYSRLGTEDRSKYQWSLVSNDQVLKEGDTTRFATGQGLVTEFIIPNAAIGDIIQLTVFPIDSNSLEGSESSIETTEIFYQIPEIRNLRVEFIEFQNVIPGGENDILRASYQFIGTEGSTDKSTYRWRLYSTKETLEEGMSVVDELLGVSFIPDLPIIPNYSGEVLELTVFPIDSNGVDGREQSVLTGNIDYIAPQVTDMSVLRMGLWDERKISVAGRYKFVPGSNSIDESTFQWISGNTGEVLSQGQVYRFEGMGNSAIPNVLVDRFDTIILKITPIDGKGNRGEPKTASMFLE